VQVEYPRAERQLAEPLLVKPRFDSIFHSLRRQTEHQSVTGM